MDLREEAARIMQEGYSEANAQSKLCQAMHRKVHF